MRARGKRRVDGQGSAKGTGVMRLYLFEHCSICFRVRMAAALKRLHLQETVLLEDDSQTMIKLVRKRVVPILVKDDGQPMLESMDMVAYIDSLGEPILVGPQRTELASWASATADKTAPLTWPRYALLGLPEFSRRARSLHRPQAKAAWGFDRVARKDARVDRRADA
jgi:glutaredoxin 2